jgi:hypothetical protein
MAVTISPYDHTAARYFSGENAVGDTYKINLYTVLPFIPAATTKSAAEVGATQVATANGYTQNSKVIASLAVTIITTNDSKLDGEDVIWTASGGIIEADYAMIFNDSDTNDPPVWHIDFGGTITALDGDPFLIQWNAGGIATLGVP